MLKNVFLEQKFRRYSLEPGDATRYQFMMGLFDQSVHAYQYIWGTENALRANINEVISGIANPYSEWVTIIFCMESTNGEVTVRTDALKYLDDSLVYYVGGKLRHYNEYTIAAILLACQTLVLNPVDIWLACKNMLNAPKLLSYKQ